MAKIDTIETIANSLSKSNIAIDYDCCLRLRNVHSKCNKCMQACPHGAIDVAFGKFEIKSTLCTNCANCVEACPSTALLYAAPNRNEIAKRARKMADASDGVCIFTCEYAAKKFSIDTSKCVTLPCLNYIDEYLICGLKAIGVDYLGLVCPKINDDYICHECDLMSEQGIFGQPAEKEQQKSVSLAFLSIVQHSDKLLKLWDIDLNLMIFDYVPNKLKTERNEGTKYKGADLAGTKKDVNDQDSKNLNAKKESSEKTKKEPKDIYDPGKRQSLEQAGRDATEFVASKINGFLKDDKEKNKTSSIQVDASKKIEDGVTLSSKVLAILNQVGTLNSGKTVQSKFWASINIDKSNCNFCGDCAHVCPTEALKYDRPENSLKGVLSFDAQLCCNCRLCEQACYHNAIILDNAVPANELLSAQRIKLFEEKPSF